MAVMRTPLHRPLSAPAWAWWEVQPGVYWWRTFPHLHEGAVGYCIGPCHIGHRGVCCTHLELEPCGRCQDLRLLSAGVSADVVGGMRRVREAPIEYGCTA